MNKKILYGIFSAIFILVIIFMGSNMLSKKASADPIQDATVSTDATTSTNTVDSSNSADSSGVSEASISTISTQHKPPVSIVNYSDEVTESSDTYDYSKKNVNSIDTTSPTIEPVPTQVPINDTPISVETTAAPTTTPNIEPTLAPSDQTNNIKITKKIFIGDSRTVHMKLAVGEKSGEIWSCKSAMGLSWMKSTGVPNIENKLTSGTAVIILMGVNDLYNTKNYISYINQKSAEWASKGVVTYFVSVNPINESSYKGFKNTRIETFNNNMQSGLQNVKYIDTYNYLITHDTSYTKDGLHYNNSTSKKIYELINQAIQ